MKERVILLLLAFVLVACTKNSEEKPENRTEIESSVRQESLPTEEEQKNDIANKMQLLKFSESEAAKIQNDMSSYGDGKTFIFHDGWFYFSRRRFFNDSGAPPEIGEIYKMKEDGSDLTKIADDAACSLLVDGDYLYYSNITDFYTPYRMKLDGSKREKLNDYRMFDFVVDGDWMFFSGINLPRTFEDVSDPPVGYFGRVKLDGSEYQKIFDDDLAYLSMDDKNLYGHFLNMRSPTFDQSVLYYPLNLLRSETLPQKLEPSIIQNVDIPYALLKDGSVIYSQVKAAPEGGQRSYWVEIKEKDGDVKKVKDLHPHDQFLNIYKGKIYTTRMKNREQMKVDRNARLEQAIVAIDENGEKELFSYGEELRFEKMIGPYFIGTKDYGEIIYTFNVETGELKQILEAYPPINLEEAKIVVEEWKIVKNILKKYEEIGYLKNNVLKNPLHLTINQPKNSSKEDLKYPNVELSKLAILSYPNRQRKVIVLNDLLEYSAEDLVKNKVMKQDVEQLLLYFKYYDHLYSQYVH